MVSAKDEVRMSNRAEGIFKKSANDEVRMSNSPFPRRLAKGESEVS